MHQEYDFMHGLVADVENVYELEATPKNMRK
jgi:hypothetical protein